MTAPLAPLSHLLTAYARGEDRERHRLVWTFDERLAAVVRTTTQPMIGQMRIAWWEEVLDDPAEAKGRGDPLVAALRETGLARSSALRSMLDGWEALLDDPLDEAALDRFAVGRGGGLFRALAGEEVAGLDGAGSLWALWDLARHLLPDDPVQPRALTLAKTFLAETDGPDWSPGWKPMRIATGLARHDVIRGEVGLAGLTPGLYARLVRIALLGR